MQSGVYLTVKIPIDLVVVTHYSGIHAQGLTFASRELGPSRLATFNHEEVVMQPNAPQRYGATVTECEPTLEAREATCTGDYSTLGGGGETTRPRTCCPPHSPLQ